MALPVFPKRFTVEEVARVELHPRFCGRYSQRSATFEIGELRGDPHFAGLAIKQWDFGREHIAPYLPSEASQAVINTALASADDVRLSWWGGAIALVAWAAVFAGIGIVRVVRQDIT